MWSILHVPSIGLELICQDHDSILSHSAIIGSIVFAGGMISVSRGAIRTHSGVLRNTINDASGLNYKLTVSCSKSSTTCIPIEQR